MELPILEAEGYPEIILVMKFKNGISGLFDSYGYV